MLQHESALGDVRRSSLTPAQANWRFPILTRNAERLLACEADHWQCIESRKLNDRIVELCRAWRQCEAPLVTSCASPWPLIKSIRIDHDDFTGAYGGYDQLDFSQDDTIEHSQTLLFRLRDLVRERGSSSMVCKCDQRRRNSISSLQEDIRKSKEFRITNSDNLQLDDTELRATVISMLHKHWGLDKTCSLLLYKISLYEPGDHFSFHRDSLHSANHYATLEVTLESSDLEGGALVFRDFEYDKISDYDPSLEGTGAGNVIKMSDYRAQDMLKMYAFYTDTEHGIESVKQGFRVSIEYQIIIGDIDDATSKKWSTENTGVTGVVRNVFHKIENKVEAAVAAVGDMFHTPDKGIECHVKDIIKCAIDNVPAGRTPALLLSHLYPLMVPDASTRLDTLRGYDRLMYDALMHSGLVGDIELMPVCLFTGDNRHGNKSSDVLPRVKRCLSLQAEPLTRKDEHKLTLFVTPVMAIHCMDALGEAYLDNIDQQSVAYTQHQFTYTTMAMILNNIKIESIKTEENDDDYNEDDWAERLAMVFF